MGSVKEKALIVTIVLMNLLSIAGLFAVVAYALWFLAERGIL